MSRDVASLVRAVSGTLRAGPVEDSRIVDAVVRLEDFAVVGHPAYATVVIASAAAAAAVIEAGGSRASELGGTVLVLPEGADAEAVLERSGATGILAPNSSPRILLAELAAILAADQASEDRGVTTGTKVLTQVARRGGARAVVAELASRIDGWAVLLDDHGQVLHTSGAGSLHIADASAVAFNRPVRVRHPGLQVHPVGLGEDLLAYLVVSSRSGTTIPGRSDWGAKSCSGPSCAGATRRARCCAAGMSWIRGWSPLSSRPARAPWSWNPSFAGGSTTWARHTSSPWTRRRPWG